MEESLKVQEPALYESLMRYRRESLRHLAQVHPEYAEIIRDFYEEDVRTEQEEPGI